VTGQRAGCGDAACGLCWPPDFAGRV